MKDAERISRQVVGDALAPNVEIIAAHLDLEGFAYVKITRTGKQGCFSADVTSMILKGEEPAGGKMGYSDMDKMFWQHPAMEKWAK